MTQANAEAARDAACVAVLPLEQQVDDDIDNTVSGSTRSLVATRPRQRQPQPRTQRVRVKWWKSSDAVPPTARNTTQVEEKSQEPVIMPTSSPPARKPAIGISQDSDSEMEGEIRSVHLLQH